MLPAGHKFSELNFLRKFRKSEPECVAFQFPWRCGSATGAPLGHSINKVYSECPTRGHPSRCEGTRGFQCLTRPFGAPRFDRKRVRSKRVGHSIARACGRSVPNGGHQWKISDRVTKGSATIPIGYCRYPTGTLVPIGTKVPIAKNNVYLKRNNSGGSRYYTTI